MKKNNISPSENLTRGNNKRQKRSHHQSTTAGSPSQDVEAGPTSSLSCKALAIVLQHLMVPDLGWSMASLDKLLVKSKHNTKEFIKTLPTKEKKQVVLDSMDTSDPNKMSEGTETIVANRMTYLVSIPDRFATFNIQVSTFLFRLIDLFQY